MFQQLRIGILSLAAIASFSIAQEEFTTGSVTGTVAGTEYTAETWAAVVPANAADHTDNEQVREMLRGMAGKTQHSASFMFMEGISMANIQLTPDTIYVSILTRTDHPEGNDTHSFKVDFPLHPETLELLDPEDVQVEFYLDGFDSYYKLTEGTVTLSAVEVIDAGTLRISGTVSGRMVRMERLSETADTTDLTLTFSIDQLGSSSAAYQLITGD